MFYLKLFKQKRQNDTLTQSYSAIFTAQTPFVTIGKDIDA